MNAAAALFYLLLQEARFQKWSRAFFILALRVVQEGATRP